MSKSATLNTRIDPTLKSRVGKIFDMIGLSHSTAIDLFYHQILIHSGLPFAVHIPNKETIKAIENTERGEGLTEYDSVDELLEDSQSW